jgi:molybdate transport system substrate-binding protein
MRPRWFPALLVLVVVLSYPALASAQITVAAASDLQTVLPEIVSRFERSASVPVRVAYGSSGNFVSQIQNGAPFDLFLSADDQYVARLVAAKLADGSSVTAYASGRLAIWTRRDRGLDLAPGITVASSPRVRRISIANPDHAPYGRAAVDALRHAGIYDAVRSKLVLGENVAQAAQFAQTGNADIGIIAFALTLAPAMQAQGQTVEVPQSAFAPIRQTGTVIARSSHQELGKRFLAFLTQPEIAALLQRSGFGPPQ